MSVEAIAMNTVEGDAPEWIELIPAGERIRGFDGREWSNPDPQAVVAATRVDLRPLVLDYEHGTQVRGEAGLEAPAAAWIDRLEVREGGSIWGRAEWTARARALVAAKEYRLVSPVFGHDPMGRITRLMTAALTNYPNLVLTALNREVPAGLNRELKETSLTLALRLVAALGLDAATATDDSIVAAATTAVAANRKGPDLTNYAPRADLDAALNRATTAETDLKTLRAAETERGIDTAISGALDAGKIVPASADQYRAMCREDGGLERFTALVSTLPVIAGAADSRAKERLPETGKSSLSDEERAVCRALGQSEEDFLKTKTGA